MHRLGAHIASFDARHITGALFALVRLVGPFGGEPPSAVWVLTGARPRKWGAEEVRFVGRLLERARGIVRDFDPKELSQTLLLASKLAVSLLPQVQN